jgi:hypothetical protein
LLIRRAMIIKVAIVRFKKLNIISLAKVVRLMELRRQHPGGPRRVARGWPRVAAGAQPARGQ